MHSSSPTDGNMAIHPQCCLHHGSIAPSDLFKSSLISVKALCVPGFGVHPGVERPLPAESEWIYLCLLPSYALTSYLSSTRLC